MNNILHNETCIDYRLSACNLFLKNSCHDSVTSHDPKEENFNFFGSCP